MRFKVTHPELITFAEAVGTRIAKQYITKGDYFPTEAWGCEGQIYPSLAGIALLRLYQATKNMLYLQGVRSIIESNAKKQMSSGGWALALGFTANGTKFKVSENIIRLTSEVEDLPPTVTAIRLMSEYQQLTGDSQYNSSLEAGYNYLKTYWNPEKAAFEEMLTGEALKLRASPRDYYIYAFQCVNSVQHILPEAKKFVVPLYKSVKKNFEAMTADTYPLLYAMHAALIIQIEGGSDYVETIVKSGLEGEIAFKSRFLIPDMPGAFGHRDGLRGVCLNEGHLRNAVGAALVLSYYDKFISGIGYTKTEFYQNLVEWIQSMYDNGKYYEFIDLNTGIKQGVGTPGQFLPIFWILGCF